MGVVADLREASPGALLTVLTFLALVFTSEESRKLALNWQFALALAAMSLPASIVIIELYSASMKGIYEKKFDCCWPIEYSKYRGHGHDLDSMTDFLLYAMDRGEREYKQCEKESWEHHLMSMLFACDVVFLLIECCRY